MLHVYSNSVGGEAHMCARNLNFIYFLSACLYKLELTYVI